MVDKETKALKIDTGDEVVKGTLVTQNGQIVHPLRSRKARLMNIRVSRHTVAASPSRSPAIDRNRGR